MVRDLVDKYSGGGWSKDKMEMARKDEGELLSGFCDDMKDSYERRE